MTITLGSGLGSTFTLKQQPTWGGLFMSTGYRTIPVKTAKLSTDPHMVQGGTYLAAGQYAALASARVLTWTDARLTLTGDMLSSGAALLFASALGTAGTLTQLGTTPAYALGGASGVTGAAPDINSTWIDMQIGIPDDTGLIHPFSLHSGVIQKAEWVFDRTGLVTYSYDMIFQQVETATGYLATSEPSNIYPFSMATSNNSAGAVPANASAFAAGVYNSEQVFPGVKKITFTLDRKLAVEADRMYLGYSLQQAPVTNDYIDLGVSIEADYTSGAVAPLFSLLLSGVSTSIVTQAVGADISGSAYYQTLALQTPAVFVDNPDAAPSPDGPKLVGSTLTSSAHIDVAGDPWLHGTLVTSDTGF